MKKEYGSLRSQLFEPKSFNCPDTSSNIDLNETLEKKALYMEEKIIEEEIKNNKIKLVILKQEESITLLENLVREAKAAEV